MALYRGIEIRARNPKMILHIAKEIYVQGHRM